MLTAEDAKRNADETNKLKKEKFIHVVLDEILGASLKGEYSLTFDELIPKTTVKELESFGYEVHSFYGFTAISWQ